MPNTDGQEKYFMGIDSSTQSLKALLIEGAKKIVGEASVNFDADLPEFKTQGGVHKHPDGLTVTSPAVMWVKALDLLLERMKKAKLPLAKVAAVSGSGQQHGTVYVNSRGAGKLGGLDPAKPLAEQLGDIFAVPNSPVWMDSSTTEQCRSLEKLFGGAQAVADLTGSRAYERFSGNQIAKISRLDPGGYRASERILLVSSFMASLFAGKYADIDVSDGSGMNLMDVRARKWSKKALDAAAPGLAGKLGGLAASHTVLGKIHRYYAERWGFAGDCVVVAFSGDNPNSLAGLRLENAGNIAVSMGTSDTLFGALGSPKPSASEGHIFASPIDPEGYMAMICYKNGSRTRESVRNESAKGSWKEFCAALKRTSPGNGGNIGFYIREPEITPPILKPGTWRFDAAGSPAASFEADAEVRALVEGQFMSMRLHCGNIGIRPARILATGGGSVDLPILQVLSDVFNVPVYTGDVPNSASLGAAYRALHGYECGRRGRFVRFAEVMVGAMSFKKALDPAEPGVYPAMLARYAELEKKIINRAG